MISYISVLVMLRTFCQNTIGNIYYNIIKMYKFISKTKIDMASTLPNDGKYQRFLSKEGDTDAEGFD